MATHSLKGTFDKSGPQNQWRCNCDVISRSVSTTFCIFVSYIKRHLCAKFEQYRTRNKEVAKIKNDVIVTSFLKLAQQFVLCEYFLLMLTDVPSFRLIEEGRIKELQTPPGWEWPKSPDRLGITLNEKFDVINDEKFEVSDSSNVLVCPNPYIWLCPCLPQVKYVSNL